jgi:AbiU2
MGESITAEESRAYNKGKMGENLGSVYSYLWQELAWLYTKWNEYTTLYGTKASRVEMLNKAAPYFFRVVQDSLWEDIVIHIARMTDPAKSMGKPNISVRQLPNLVEGAELREQLESLVSIAKVASEFCRGWRNRRIAHRDHDLALGNNANPLTPGSREKVKKALQALADILDAVSTHYLESSTMFDMGANHGGGELLLRVLHNGLEAQEARRQRVLAGLHCLKISRGSSYSVRVNALTIRSNRSLTLTRTSGTTRHLRMASQLFRKCRSAPGGLGRIHFLTCSRTTWNECATA